MQLLQNLQAFYITTKSNIRSLVRKAMAVSFR